MQVGDLVMSNGHMAIVICVNAHETYRDEVLIMWFSDGTVADAANYSESLEVISASR